MSGPYPVSSGNIHANPAPTTEMAPVSLGPSYSGVWGANPIPELQVEWQPGSTRTICSSTTAHHKAPVPLSDQTKNNVALNKCRDKK
jgi:hypothetical protein